MNYQAYRLLSLSLGFLLLFHGLDKMVYGISFIQSLVTQYVAPDHHVPFSGFFPCMSYGMGFMKNTVIAYNAPYLKYVAYTVYIGEVIAPIFLLFGHFIRTASAIIMFNMFVVIFLVYRNLILSLDEQGILNIEVPLLYFIMAVTLMFWKEKKV